jgi:hypothetical protein
VKASVVAAYGDSKVMKYQNVAAIGINPEDMIERNGDTIGTGRRTVVLRATTPLRGRNCRK